MAVKSWNRVCRLKLLAALMGTGLTDQICVAIDGMGGDNAPHMIVGGVNRAAHTHQNVSSLFLAMKPNLVSIEDFHQSATV